MLAKAPLNLHESLKYFKKERLLFTSERMRCPKSTSFSVRAAYTRKPTGTLGAYQLIDDDTGDKFIIWGGADDVPDSLIPPKKVLSWNLDNACSSQQVEKKSNMQGTRMGGCFL